MMIKKKLKWIFLEFRRRYSSSVFQLFSRCTLFGFFCSQFGAVKRFRFFFHQWKLNFSSRNEETILFNDRIGFQQTKVYFVGRRTDFFIESKKVDEVLINEAFRSVKKIFFSFRQNFLFLFSERNFFLSFAENSRRKRSNQRKKSFRRVVAASLGFESFLWKIFLDCRSLKKKENCRTAFLLSFSDFEKKWIISPTINSGDNICWPSSSDRAPNNYSLGEDFSIDIRNERKKQRFSCAILQAFLQKYHRRPFRSVQEVLLYNGVIDDIIDFIDCAGTRYQLTPLIIASGKGFFLLVFSFIFKSIFIFLSLQGSYEKVKILLVHGANPNKQCSTGFVFDLGFQSFSSMFYRSVVKPT